jgi:hypothetical protein
MNLRASENEGPKAIWKRLGRAAANLLEGAPPANLLPNSLAAYGRTWRAFLAWDAAAGLDPRALSFPTAPEAYRFREGKNAANLKKIRAALSFAYKHWDAKSLLQNRPAAPQRTRSATCSLRHSTTP